MKTTTVSGTSLFYILAALAALATARHETEPRATGSVALPLDGFSPKPTPPPAVHQLLRRQDSSSEDQTLLIAPDATCGYISARPGAPYYCYNDFTCVLMTSQATASGAVACCDDDDCYFRASCVDYEQYYSSSACNDICALDMYTLKCTNSLAPYCNTVSFEGGAVDYWCNSLSISSTQLATTAYSGQTGRSFSPVVVSGSISESLTGGTSAPPGPTTNPDGDNADDGNDNGDEDGNADQNEDGDDNDGDDDGGDSTPIGAIVGGVVGGVAAISLAAVGVWFFLRNKKKRQQQQQQPQSQSQFNHPPSMQQSPPGYPPSMQQSPPGQPPSPYDPKYAVPLGTPPPNQYPHSPTGFYAQQQHSPMTAGAMTVSSNTPSDPGHPQMAPGYAPAGYPQGGYQQQPGYPQQQGYPPQQAVAHEVPVQTSDHHRGQLHEMG